MVISQRETKIAVCLFCFKLCYWSLTWVNGKTSDCLFWSLLSFRSSNVYSLLHVYYRTNRMHDKTGGSCAGLTAGWEKARRGGRTKYDGIVKAWGFMCLVFSFGLGWFSLFVQCLGNSPTMGKSLANPFIAAKLSVLKPFFNCWTSWAELNCKESGLLEPILKIEALKTGFFILTWPARVSIMELEYYSDCL